MYSIKEFEEIKNFLESHNINFEESGRYDDDGFIVGHCLAINTEIFTDEINDEDMKYNGN